MKQGNLISFTSVVASLLLCKRCITSSEIVNFTSKLNCKELMIDDDWNIDELVLCVDMSTQYSFILKDNLSYDSVLYKDITVLNFLVSYSNEQIMKVIQEDNYFKEFYFENYQKNIRKIARLDDDSLSLEKGCFWDVRGKNVFSRVKKKNPWYSFFGGVH